MERQYDQFWSTTDTERRDARSRERGEAALSLVRPATSGRVLDVGCGRGVVAALWREKGFDVTGVDFSSQALEEAERRGVPVISGSLDEIEVGETYDVILCLEVLEHLPDPLAMVERMKSWLAPGGAMIISLPNEFHLLRRLAMVAGYFPFAGHEYPHLHLFHRPTIARFFAAAGLDKVRETALPLCPPRYPAVLRLPSRWLARIFPGFFSISLMYRLEIV